MNVIVYSNPNCGPCMGVKRFLKTEGIEFEERNCSEHSEYLETIGARSAPIVVIGDTVIHGFDPQQMKQLLV